MVLLFAGLQVAFAQRAVTGRITRADDGTPLAGVTVLVKGTTTGALSDANGNYSIQVPDDQSVLHFSFIGFTTVEAPVGSQSVLNMQMEEALLQMNEVVVTALGIKREAKSLGYAATAVNTDQISENTSVNMGNALMGKVAGLNVAAPATGPGGSSKLRIRGQSSFGSSNTPLVVINGVPIQNETQTTGIQADFGDGLQSINPEDIETITVLKGATAAALYGYRAKDGVIIMTTKSGVGAKGLGIEVTQGMVFDQALDFSDFQYVYGQGEDGVRPNSVASARGSGVWSFGEKMDGQPVWCFDGKQHPYSPVKDRLKFYDLGITSNTTVAFTGGNDNGGFHFSVGNVSAKAITPNSKFTKRTIDYGINYKFGKLTLQSNANYSLEYNQNPPGSTQGNGIANTIYTTAVSSDITWLKNNYKDPVTGNEIQFSRFADRTNPYWTAYERFENRNRNRLFGNILLKYDFLPWLYVQGRVGQDWSATDTENNEPTGTAYLRPAASGFNGSYAIGKSVFRELNYDFLVGLERTFGKFSLDAQFGGNAMDRESSGVRTSVTNFYIRGLYTIENGQTKTPSQSYSHKKVNSLYGTLNLAFNDYLYLNATARNDWFSTLNPQSNSYLYPSVGTSFLFSEAFRNFVPSWLTFGKIRASYAEVGGDTNPYQGALTYSLSTNAFDGVYQQGNISNSSAPNPNLRPLKVKEAEAGIELIFLDRLVSLDLAAYRKNTVDEILSVGISNASGYSSTLVNVGRLRNTGFEGLLTVVPIRTQNFSWETSFNYSYNISKVLQLAEGATTMVISGYQQWLGREMNAHEVGKPLGSLRGYDYVRDENGNILTTNGFFKCSTKPMTYGSVIPKHVGGWMNTFTYKNFRLMAQFDFKAGHKIVTQSNYNFTRHGHAKWTLDGREGGVIMDAIDATTGLPNTVAVPVETFYGSYSSQRVYTPFIYDGSFIKFRTLTFSADLTKYIRNLSFIKGLAVNASINNVAVLLSHVDNLDPECVSSVDDNNAGIEIMGPPHTRSYGVTIKASF